MALVQTAVTSYKVELLTATHDFTPITGDVFKLALYGSAATLNEDTTVYSATDEITGTGYIAGGTTLTSIAPTSSGTTAVGSFDTAIWPAAVFTASGGLIYNSTKGDKAVAVLDFGSDKTCTGNDFTVQFPIADSSSAIIRIA